jgi:CoA-transferase family III
MKRILSAIGETGAQFESTSRVLGRSVAVDPARLLERDAALGLTPPGIWSPNRHCRLIEAQDGWMAVSLARDDDVRCVPAWTGCALGDEPWHAVITYLRQISCATALEASQLLHLPVAQLNEAHTLQPSHLSASAGKRAKQLKAIDLSALWAGPLCGALLAAAGVEVTRIQSPTRPDSTPEAAPILHHRLNGQKETLSMALGDPELLDAISKADILITNGRPHALARHGLTEDAIFALNPALIWVAITAHGWRGEAAMRTGFGDDCAAAGGLISWSEGMPHFMGDALADPLTGLEAALGAARAVEHGHAGLIDIALSQTAARYAERIGLR